MGIDHSVEVSAAARRNAVFLSRRAVLKAGLCGGAAMLLAGCWLFPAEWYEKLTVTVETPHGDVSGSSVRWQKLVEDMLLDRASSDEAGEAVVVEVAPGKYLFVLMEENMPQAELIYFPGEPPLKSTHKLNGIKGQVIDVPTSQYPLMVTFGNLADPNSIKQVFPNDLAAAFGSEYRLKSVTLEIVDGPVTVGTVATALPWMFTQEGAFSPSVLKPSAEYSFAEKMSKNYFIREQ